MTDLLFGLAVVFIAAGALLVVANHFELATVPFLILAGLAAGQFVPEDQVLELARWGIAFLVFVFAVRLNFETLASVFTETERVGVVGFGAVAVVAGSAGLLLGLGPEGAATFAIVAGLSSTIVGEALLRTEIRENLVYGRLAQSIQFVQDLLAVLLLLVLSAETLTHSSIAAKLGYGVLLLAAAAVVNRHVFGWLRRLADDSEELLMLAAVSILICFVAVVEYLGISVAVGAFAAGLAVRGDATDALGMLNAIDSIRDFFVPIFFVTLGALVSLPSVEVLTTAAVLAVVVAVVKPLVTIALLVGEGYDLRSATLTGVGLDQVSEFSLIIAIEAFLLGVIAPELFEAIILAAAATMITSALTRQYDERLVLLFEEVGLLSYTHGKMDAESHVPDDLDEPVVVVVGYGRQGRRVVDACREVDRDVVVIENDPLRLDDLRDDDVPRVFGDAMYAYTWEKAGVSDAPLVVSTVKQRPVSERVLELVAGTDADTDVILRAPDRETARDLLDDGATYVTVPDLLAADHLLDAIREIDEDPETRETLRQAHLDRLEALDAAGFRSLADDRSR